MSRVGTKRQGKVTRQWARKRDPEKARRQPRGNARRPGRRKGKGTRHRRSAIARQRKAAAGKVGRVAEDSCAARIEIAERVGGHVDRSRSALQVPVGLSATIPARAGKSQHATRTNSKAVRIDLSLEAIRAFAALGHPQRGRILRKLLEGPATYRSLQRLTRMKAGPLYHHVNQLRLSGLLLPKQRDLYELTRAGRNLVLAALAVSPLLKDRRRRPVSRFASIV